VTEAICGGVNPTDIAALSLGTATVALPWPNPGDPPSPFLQQKSKDGLTNDLHKLATAILDDPPDIATFLAHVMTGSGKGVKAPADSRIVRMNPLISPVKGPDGAWTAPGGMATAQFAYLADLDMDAVDQSQVDAISRFTDLWLQGSVTNQPVRMNHDTLEREIGQTSFKDALAAWNAIR
jgi:hypothetical protein